MLLSSGLATVNCDEKGHWGYLSAARQEPAIKAQYIEVNPFSEGLAGVGIGTN